MSDKKGAADRFREFAAGAPELPCSVLAVHSDPQGFTMTNPDAIELARRWLAQNDAERQRNAQPEAIESDEFGRCVETYPNLEECRVLARAVLQLAEERDWNRSEERWRGLERERDEACRNAEDLRRRLENAREQNSMWAPLVAWRHKVEQENSALRAALKEACEIAEDESWTNKWPEFRLMQRVRIAALKQIAEGL